MAKKVQKIYPWHHTDKYFPVFTLDSNRRCFTWASFLIFYVTIQLGLSEIRPQMVTKWKIWIWGHFFNPTRDFKETSTVASKRISAAKRKSHSVKFIASRVSNSRSSFSQLRPKGWDLMFNSLSYIKVNQAEVVISRPLSRISCLSWSVKIQFRVRHQLFLQETT